MSDVFLVLAFAWRLGDEGRGVSTIIEMVNMTRLDCTIGSAAIMSAAVMQASHHAAYRSAVGARQIDQPSMRNVLADLAIEAEASTRPCRRGCLLCEPTRWRRGIGATARCPLDRHRTDPPALHTQALRTQGPGNSNQSRGRRWIRSVR